MLKLITMAMATTAVAVGAWASVEYQFDLEGRLTYLVVAAAAVPIFAAFLPECYTTAWRAKHRLLALCLFAVFVGCCAQVFLAATQRMHAAQAGPAAARDAARAAVADAERALADAKAKAEKAEADAKAARKLPRQPATKKSAASSWCDAGCLKRWDDEATAARQRVADAQSALTTARGNAVSESSLKPAAWLLPLDIDAAGIVLWAFVPLLPWPKRRAKAAEAPQVEVKVEPVAAKPEAKAKRQARKPRGQRLPKTAIPSVTVAARRAGMTLH